MEIILLENIMNLGNIGDKVTVKPGYGRNFLLKSGKALRYSKENLELVSKKKNIPFIVVLTEPSTGGSLASWASLGDLQISEKNVRNISFAGARVVQQTIRETLPDDFGSSKFQMDKGQVDLIVERKDLNSTIGTLLNILTKKAELVDNQSNVKVDKSIQTAS